MIRRRAAVSSQAGGLAGVPSGGPRPRGRLERVGQPVLGEVEPGAPRDEQGQQPAPLVAQHRLQRVQPSVLGRAPDLDRVRRRQQPGQLDRGLQVGQVDDPEPAQLLGGLGVRPLGDGPVGARAECDRLGDGRQALATD